MTRLVRRGFLHSGLWLLKASGPAAVAVAALGGAVARAEAGPGALVYIGTMAGGSGEGIVAARFDEASGHLTKLGTVAAGVELPTWLVAHPTLPVLYATSETGDATHPEGGVVSLKADPTTGKLAEINRLGSGGQAPTDLALDAASGTLFTANYGTGEVAAFGLESDGSLDARRALVKDVGHGPMPQQAGPHAHCAVVDPTRRFVLVADLGADRIFIDRFDPARGTLTPSDPPFEPLPPATGPRHLAFSRNGRLLFLMSEMASTLFSYQWDADHGRLHLLQSLPTIAADSKGVNNGAEVAVSPDGKHVYVSNRGEDSIVAFSIDPATGKLTLVQRVSAQVHTPRSFTIDPTGRWMIVAGQGSDRLAVLKLDAASGMLGATGESLAVKKPVNVTFFHG